jgi:hypothetical protein
VVDSNGSKAEDGLKISLLYVDKTLVGKCYDTDEAIKAYKAASERYISDEDYLELETRYKILVRLQDDVQKTLFEVLTNRDFICHNCRLCPSLKERTSQEYIKPTWATKNSYDSLLQTHFDELGKIGKRICARLETLLYIDRKYGEKGTLELEGNIIDGLIPFSHLPGDPFKFGHTYDIDKQDMITQLDCLLANCLQIHFNYSLSEEVSSVDWYKVNFDNLETEMVHRLHIFLEKKSFKYLPQCPVCAAISNVFQI